ncbi:MAG: TIGR04076 family protein [Dehalococcoidales bacterium]|nr:MAG: TIGR04076 family protein [Dehalococcoidales bacterium]
MGIEPNIEKMNELKEALQKGTRPIDDQMIEDFISCTPNYEVSIKVVSQEGICLGKHKVGDEWVMKGRGDYWRSPNICMFAFTTIYPSIQMLMYGGSFPWEPDMDVVLAPCPDSRNPVVFELRRTKVV